MTGGMKRSRLILCVCMFLSVLTASYGAVAQRCHMCGMDAAKSQTEFLVHLSDRSEEHACCLHCVYLLKNFIKDREFLKIETRDFTNGNFISAEQALYLEGSSLLPKGSMAPFILAFSDKESAEKYQKKHGGNIVDWTKAMEIVGQFDNKLNSGE